MMKIPILPEVFVSRITRKELKTDRFALEVGHTVTFFEEHQKQIVRYGAIGLVVIILLVGYLIYSRRQHASREQALARAIQIQESQVGPPSPGQNFNFPTQDLKDQSALKAFSDLVSTAGNTTEGHIARYYIGAIQADQGKLGEAEKSFKEVADNGDKKFSALAKLSLAQIYFADGRADQGEKVLRELIASPTIFVSADQATLTLAKYLAPKKPAEARKLVEPLRGKTGPVGTVALQLYQELPPQ
jgi:predicted negative regulator of RcsB-dependent stress response